MAGYWNNERATREVLRDGWLYTGDLGHLDTDGFLYVVGRAKSLLISNDGEKYSPEGIEETIIANSEYIDQVLLYNSQSAYTVALIVPSRDALLRWLASHNLSARSEAGQRRVLDLLQHEIDQYREGGIHAGQFPGKWLPAAVGILGEAFTEQNRMLNTTLKMVRGTIVECHRSRLDFLYTPEAKDIRNRQNMTVVSRMDA
jgi:long-chain acyl-CoA synthetase